MINGSIFDVGTVLGDEAYIGDYYMDEKWAFVNNTPNYMISDKGRVYSLKTGKLIKQKHMDREGHLGFSSFNNGVRKYHYTHREMGKSFLPNNDNYPIVRHLDDDKDNNCLDNLAWGTSKDNHIDSVKNGSFKPFSEEAREKGLEKVRHKVIAKNIKSKEKIEFNSLKEAARQLNLQQSNVWKVANKKRKQTGGWTFKDLGVKK